MQRLSTTETALLALASNALMGREQPLPPQVDWREVLREAEKQAVLSCLMSCQQVSEQVRGGELREMAEQLLANNMQVFYAHTELHRLMTENGIPYVILKGCASASYYPTPILRTMGDVDFFVPPALLDKADRVLREAGFTVRDRNHDLHIVCDREDGHFELHFAPVRYPEGAAGQVLRRLFDDLLERSRQRSVAGFEMCLPSDLHHGLLILLHTVRHLFDSGIGLRHLCDWAVFVEGFSNEAFREVFEGPLREAGLWRSAQLLTLVCIRYLGCTPKEWAGAAPNDLLEAILTDIFQGGNFGVKDPVRSHSAMLLSQVGGLKAGKNGGLVQLLRTMNRMTCTRWPIAKGFPLLLPLGWLFWGIRYEVRVLLGRRKQLNPAKMSAEAERRSAVYREFHLYEE